MSALLRRIAVLLAVAFAPAISLAMVVPLAAQTTPPFTCAQTYIVQQGDWLSTIARQAYGDSLAWSAIVDATNAAARSDATFTAITNPERIEVGQKLCLPVRAGTPPALPPSLVAAATPALTATLLATPTAPLTTTVATTVPAAVPTTVTAAVPATVPLTVPTTAATTAVLTSTTPATAAVPLTMTVVTATAPLSAARVSYGGVAFQLDPRLAASAQGFTVPAVSPAELPLFAAAPAHVAFVFGADDLRADLTALADASVPKLRVYPVADLRALAPIIARSVDDLAQLLATRPASIAGTIPVFPVINAAQVFRVHIRYLDFADGSGVRFVTHYAQDASPVVAKTIFYIFQGLSADGEWYISAIWPLDATILPATTEAALGGQSYEAFVEDFDRYLRQLVSDLDALQPAAFIPDLASLDAWIESLTISSALAITPTAELTPSPPSAAAVEADLAAARGTLRLRGGVAYGDPRVGAEIAATHPRPALALVDQGGLYVGGDPSFVAPPAAQIYATIEGDLAASPFTYTIDLPVAPRGGWWDVDQDGVREIGVQIFAISLFDDLSDLPAPHTLTPLEQAHGGRLSSLLTALPPSPALPPIPIGGALIVYAPDDQQGFPAGFGADGQLFTADDPITSLAAGWTVVTLDGSGFTFRRDPEVVVPLHEPSARVPRDLSELGLVEAFGAVVDMLRERYPFTVTRALDWEGWRAELTPQVEKAQTANDLAAWYAAVAQLIARLADEQVTLTLPSLLAALSADQESTAADLSTSAFLAGASSASFLAGENGQRYGYLRVSTFDVTPSDVALWQRALRQFVAARAPAVVLDLRGDVGGRALGAELLAGHFFTAGQPLLLDGWVRRQFDPADGLWKTTGPLGHAPGLALAATSPAVAFDGQLVVLIDEDCRDACALMTAWLQRAGRAYVIGVRSTVSDDAQPLLAAVASYGVIELPGGGRLTYPNAAELLADGQPVAIQADLAVEAAAGEEDPALVAAVTYLDERSAAEAPAAESVPIIVRTDYRCAAGRSLRVISTPASALVTFAGKARLLDRRVAASGERFADEAWEWWSKGEEGFLAEVSSGAMLAEGCVAR